MTDFVIVAVTAVVAALAPAANAPRSGSDAAPPAVVDSAPLARAPTVGFRVYPDVAACEAAAASLTAPAGGRLVCVPVEPQNGDMASAY
jgi:hypothetical protein